MTINPSPYQPYDNNGWVLPNTHIPYVYAQPGNQVTTKTTTTTREFDENENLVKETVVVVEKTEHVPEYPEIRPHQIYNQ